MILSAKKSLSKIKTRHICLLCIGLFISPVLSIAQNWQALANGVSSAVLTLYNDTSSSKLYVGGSFLYADGFSANGIASWNGTNWDTLGTGIGSGASPVVSICRFNGELFASTYSNQSLYKWTGSNWQNIPCNGPVLQLYPHNTDLYAVGWFDTIGGVAASKVAKFNGSNWSAIDTTKWWSGAINCVIVFNNELYIGGNMVNYNGSIENIAKWNGSNWQPVGNNEMAGGLAVVNCFSIYNNELFVGGYFSTTAGNPGNHIAKWDGTQWSDVGGGMDLPNGQVWCLKNFNNELYAGGMFFYAGGIPAQFLAKWDGNNWCGFGNTYSPGNIASIESFNNELYIGGGFKTIDNDTVNYIAKWIGGNYTDTCGNTTSIKENANSTIILVYPNPTQDILNIDLPEISNNYAIIEIYNTLGEKVYTGHCNAKKNQINLSALISGIYLIQIKTENDIISKKIIKQN